MLEKAGKFFEEARGVAHPEILEAANSPQDIGAPLLESAQPVSALVSHGIYSLERFNH